MVQSAGIALQPIGPSLFSGTLHNAQASDSARCHALVSGSKGYARHCSRGKACKRVLRIAHRQCIQVE